MKRCVFSVSKDERFNFLFSIQKTESKKDNWYQWYIGFLFWTFSFLFVEKRI